MTSRKHHSFEGSLFIILTLASCASRTPPTSFSAGSAASPSTEAGVRPKVTLALESDPPLEAAEAAGWAGLTPAKAKDGAGHDHHEHHHHEKHEKTPKAEDEPAHNGGEQDRKKPKKEAPEADDHGTHDHAH